MVNRAVDAFMAACEALRGRQEHERKGQENDVLPDG